MKKLPKKVFIAWQEEGTETEFLEATTSVNELVDQDQECKVGLYELKEIKTAVNKTELV